MGDILREKLDLERRLADILHEAIALADLGQSRVPSHTIAERIFTEQPELMAELHHLWAVERLIWMIARARRVRRSEQVEEYLKSLRERYAHHHKVAQMEAVLEKMRLYTGEKRGITWGEVKTLIADALEG